MYKINIPRQMGQIIKENRLEQGLTQEQLAKLSQTSRSLIYRLEKGTTNGIMLDKLFDVLEALGLGLAVTNARNNPKEINKITMGHAIEGTQRGTKKRSSSCAQNRKAVDKKSSSRNIQAQIDEELKAIQNIRGLDSARYIKG